MTVSSVSTATWNISDTEPHSDDCPCVLSQSFMGGVITSEGKELQMIIFPINGFCGGADL